jgi:glucarate dehydratase
MRISRITITPVAFADPPLLNSVGVHEPFALRAVIEVATDEGLAGLGETYADEGHLDALRAAAAAIEGADVYRTEEIYRRVQAVAAPETTIASGLIGHSAATDRVFSPFEVACLDIQGRRPGGRSRTCSAARCATRCRSRPTCSTSGPAHPGAEPDGWGEALDPAGIVAQARRMVDGYGFTALKLKGGVFPPAQEIEAIRALRAPSPTIRCGWTRTPRGPPRRRSRSPATWTACWSTWRTRRRASTAWRRWRGPRRCRWPPTCAWWPSSTCPRPSRRTRSRWCCPTTTTGAACAGPAAGRDLRDVRAGPVHALQLAPGHQPGRDVHLAAATPNLSYACDTHWPWKSEDVVRGEPLVFAHGAVRVPDAPGLGVELDRDALARLHEQYLASGLRRRDDTGYMQRIDPGYERKQPRW